jgi:hypothetical protein
MSAVSDIMKRRYPPMRYPTFLVIGAAKSGSTSLHDYLGQHPDIFMSRTKEPNFFSFDGATPEFRYPAECLIQGGAARSRLRNATLGNRISSLAEYQRLFAKVTAQRAVGESSVNYLYSMAAPRLIKESLPGVRLVAILRNPADRAYSRFLHARRDGMEPLSDFAAALDAETQRIAEGYAPVWHYRQRGYYHQQLARYYGLFDRERIHVILYDDFCRDPLGQIQGLFRFLDVDPTFVPDMSRRLNVSGKPLLAARSWLLDDLLNTPNPVKSFARWLLPDRALESIRRQIMRFNSRSVPSPAPCPMPPDLRRRLLDDYRSDILQLQDLIGIDLSRWLQ